MNIILPMILIITGNVVSIKSIDVDKSGKNPNYMLFVKINVESVENSDGISIDSVVTIQAKESDFIKQLGRKLKVGDRVVVSAEVYDKHPQVLPLGKIRFAMQKNE